ncbi:MAG: hypothetical protein SGPRY_004396 [Prymnesium sp.]
MAHSEIAQREAVLARAAYTAGVTYVIENPVDSSRRGSAYFSQRFQRHTRRSGSFRLVQMTQPMEVTLSQCAFQGEFQRITSLLAAGPWASRLQALAWAQCTHRTHQKAAKEYSQDGVSEAERAAAYPPLFAAVVGVMLEDGAPVGRNVLASLLCE